MGYCRVTKIIRYLVKHHEGSDEQIKRSLSVLLRDANLADAKKLRGMVKLFVKCGLYNADKYRHGPDDRYHAILRQMSHNLNLPEARKDPFTKLPRELIGIIFSHLDTTALLRCCRVSKTWRQIIEADAVLWSSIKLKRPRTSRYLAKFLQRHRVVRSLMIDDFSRLDFSIDKLSLMLRLLPNLRHLRIGTPDLFKFPPGKLDVQNRQIAPLERVSLLFDARRDPEVWRDVLSKLAGRLEVLDLVPGVAHNLPLMSPFTKLKKLSLIFPYGNYNTGMPSVEMVSLPPSLGLLTQKAGSQNS